MFDANLSLTADHVARATRETDGPRYDPNWRLLDDDDLRRLTAALLQGRPRPVPIFAYGSLIWNPGFAVQASRRATAHGWHRDFSILLDHFRGTPEQPGLMLALAEGGSCEGLVLDMAEGTETEAMVEVLRRELVAQELARNACWIEVETERGTEQALTFYAPPVATTAAGLPIEGQAALLARANGPAGSGADYLRRTVQALQDNGLRDPYRWELERLVAGEIDRLYPAGG